MLCWTAGSNVVHTTTTAARNSRRSRASTTVYRQCSRQDIQGRLTVLKVFISGALPHLPRPSIGAGCRALTPLTPWGLGPATTEASLPAVYCLTIIKVICSLLCLSLCLNACHQQPNTRLHAVTACLDAGQGRAGQGRDYACCHLVIDGLKRLSSVRCIYSLKAHCRHAKQGHLAEPW